MDTFYFPNVGASSFPLFIAMANAVDAFLAFFSFYV